MFKKQYVLVFMFTVLIIFASGCMDSDDSDAGGVLELNYESDVTVKLGDTFNFKMNDDTYTLELIEIEPLHQEYIKYDLYGGDLKKGGESQLFGDEKEKIYKTVEDVDGVGNRLEFILKIYPLNFGEDSASLKLVKVVGDGESCLLNANCRDGSTCIKGECVDFSNFYGEELDKYSKLSCEKTGGEWVASECICTNLNGIYETYWASKEEGCIIKTVDECDFTSTNNYEYLDGKCISEDYIKNELNECESDEDCGSCEHCITSTHHSIDNKRANNMRCRNFIYVYGRPKRCVECGQYSKCETGYDCVGYKCVPLVVE